MEEIEVREVEDSPTDVKPNLLYHSAANGLPGPSNQITITNSRQEDDISRAIRQEDLRRCVFLPLVETNFYELGRTLNSLKIIRQKFQVTEISGTLVADRCATRGCDARAMPTRRNRTSTQVFFILSTCQKSQFTSEN